MRHSTRTLVAMFVVAVMMGAPCLAQDVEPPFTWAGEGQASFISQGGIEDIEFEIEMSVDAQGKVQGQTSNEDGVSRIQHLFSSAKREFDFGGIYSRDVVIVLLFNEYSDSPMLSILNGRLLLDKFFYGEVMLGRYEEGSDLAKALGVGDPYATWTEEGALPYELRSALRECLPIGVVQIQGDYKEQEAGAAAEANTVTLFSGRDLEGWHIHLKDANADPASVWKVRDGAIWCAGKPHGFLRTKKQFSDFKLTLEWRWPEKPTNSGVLVRMDGAEKVWPFCMEAQLMHNRAGDVVGMGCDFNENKSKEGQFFRYAPRKNESNEKAPGGWNTYEIVCRGDTMELTVNGQLQNKATGITRTDGYIGLQSEGSPIMFRNIKLTPLN